MTPQQKLKHMILLSSVELGAEELPADVTADNIDDLYEERDSHDDGDLQDARSEIRCSGVETELETPGSRHYEVDAVAAPYLDGSWVGWNYWYGGGKHGDPEAMPWIEGAYALNCAEEQVTVTKRTFTTV